MAARVRAGHVPPADLNRMETRRQAELANRADLAGSAAEARTQLAVALGLGGAASADSHLPKELTTGAVRAVGFCRGVARGAFGAFAALGTALEVRSA